MGITGLYAELGPGERIALAKLADDHLQSTGRQLRIAIDVSIWSFQTQAAQGGTNPALRTLYYRLTRLLTLPIQALFVFDGPHRPQFKRHHRTATVPGYITSRQKTLISLFGFPYHTAPGEAEAECANLQKLGIVDATLSEDVDTLMFGCGKVLRNWSAEKGTGAVPTHVTVYDLDKIEKERSLSPEGMIMVALMSGGDYIPAGVPGCGIRIAVDAARAGYGKELCSLGGKGDENGLRDWRERFTHELRTNEHKLFTRKNNKIVIPNTFPDKQVLGYYLHPKVSGERDEIVVRGPQWGGEVNWRGLREFVEECFEWKGKGGAKKLMRTLAGGLLVRRLLRGLNVGREDKRVKDLVEKISGRRVHHSTDGLAELRVAYTAAIVVPIDLDDEPEDDGIGIDGCEEDEDVASGDEQEKGTKRKPKEYDPFVAEKAWISERILRLGVSEVVQEWEDSLTKPNKKGTTKAKAPSAGAKKGRAKAVETEKDAGAIEKFLKVTKPTMSAPVSVPAAKAVVDLEDDEEWWIPPPPPRRDTAPQLPTKGQPNPPPAPVAKAPRVVSNPTGLPTKKSTKQSGDAKAAITKAPASKGPSKRISKLPAPVPGSSQLTSAENVNPWSLAAKRPQAPVRATTEGLVGAAAASSKNKSQVKSRSVSDHILSSPLPTPVKNPSQGKGKPLYKASPPRVTAEVDGPPPRGLFKSKKPTSSKSNDNKYRSEPSRSKSYGIPSSPPTVENYFPDEPSSPDLPSPIQLYGEKKQRKSSPPIEVIDLVSSSPAPCFSADISSITDKWASGVRQEPSSSAPGTLPLCVKSDLCEESPSKKIKTPESIRRASIAEENEADLFNTVESVSHKTSNRLSRSFIIPAEETSFDYDEGNTPFGYDDHFGYYEQDTADLEDDPTSRIEAIEKVNRVLDFSAPPPALEIDDSKMFFPQPLTYLPHLDTSMTALGYTHSRNGSTASTTSSAALSDFSIPLSTPTTERQPVRDFSWITATRGNYSPRKQLKRVMEGVFPSPLSPDSPLEIFKSEQLQNEHPAANLSPIEALHEIMNAPIPVSAPSPPLKEQQQFSWDRRGSHSSSRTSDGSVSSSISLGPGFDEHTASAPIVPDQKTPPRRTRSMIPVPSAKKNKPQTVSPTTAAATTIKVSKTKQQLQQQQQKLTEKMGKVKKAATAPPPNTNITTAAKPPSKTDISAATSGAKKLTVRQSIDSGIWKELEEFGKMQTIGRKSGLNVKRSLGKIKVWDDVDFVDLTGE